MIDYLPPVLLCLAMLNIVSFAAYGIDKLKARKGWWRISERCLLMLAFLGGSVGAWLAMRVFRHKTLHAMFRYGVPLAMLCHLSLAAWLLFEFMN